MCRVSFELCELFECFALCVILTDLCFTQIYINPSLLFALKQIEYCDLIFLYSFARAHTLKQTKPFY